MLTDFPEYTGGDCAARAPVLDTALGDGLAHSDHGALLGAFDFAAATDTDAVVPGSLDRDEVDFAFELTVDVV